MTHVACSYCGRELSSPASAEAAAPRYCCLGCVLRAKVPVDAEGNFPVNAHLGIALGIGFIYFNQLLCWGMSAAARAKGRTSLASGFERAEVVSAVLVVVGIVVFQGTTRTQCAKEWLLTAVSVAVVARALALPPLSGALLAAGSGIMLAWCGRGIFRRPRKG